jgi:hypothetical protein
VPIRTLDSYEFDNVGLIKIDVEGFEEKVLRGGVKTIARCKPILYIEDDRPELSGSLRKFITELGYSIEEHRPPLTRGNNYFGNNIYIYSVSGLGSHNLVCRPC